MWRNFLQFQKTCHEGLCLCGNCFVEIRNPIKLSYDIQMVYEISFWIANLLLDFSEKKWCHFITNNDWSESIFNFYIGIMTLQLVCSLKPPLWCKIFNFKWIFFHHIILYKNVINEFFFIKLKKYLLWNKFQYMKVQKNDAMTSKKMDTLACKHPLGMKVYSELGSSNMQMGVCFDLGNSQCA